MKSDEHNLWFIADLHLGHRNIIGYAGRPFLSVDEMDHTLITNWNKFVQEDDTVIVIGDMFLCSKAQSRAFMKILKGRKILIRGNHDQNANRMRRLGFDFVCDELKITLGGHKLKISHYPYAPTFWEKLRCKWDTRLLDRRPKDEGEWLLQAHVHQAWKIRPEKRMICLSVENWNYGPVHANELLRILQKYHKQD